MNSFKMSLDASLSQILCNMLVSLLFSFPISVAMRSSLLNDIIFELREGLMYIEWRARLASLSFKRCPQVQQTMP